MTDDDRAECWPVVKAIEQAGGLTKADDATLAEAKRLNLVKRSKGGNRYTEFEHSLFVLATVMSATTTERVVVDAGLKSYSMEKGPPWVHGRAGLEPYGVSDEHARVRVLKGTPTPKLGEKLMLIPGHCDPTINLHDWYVGIRRGRVEALWPIAARGASR